MKTLLLVFTLSFASMQAQTISWTKLSCANADSVDNISFFGNNVYVSTWAAGVYRSTDNGDSWTQNNSGLTDWYTWATRSINNKLYTCTDGDGIFTSGNNGDSWSQINSPLLLTASVFDIIGNGNTLFAGTYGSGLLRSNDGTSWVSVKKGIDGSGTIFSLFSFQSILYAGTDNGVYYSEDGGTSWNQSNSGLLDSTYVLCFTSIGNSMFIGTGGTGFYRSDDNGQTWIDINNGFTTDALIFAMASQGTYLFAAGDALGLLISSDMGQTWQQKNTGLSGGGASAVGINNSKVYVSTGSGAIFRGDISILGVQESSASSFPMNIIPNPASDYATLTYYLPYTQNISLEIFDLLGNKIQTKNLGEQSEGNHEIALDVSTLMSGMYRCRLFKGNSFISSFITIHR